MATVASHLPCCYCNSSNTDHPFMYPVSKYEMIIYCNGFKCFISRVNFQIKCGPFSPAIMIFPLVGGLYYCIFSRLHTRVDSHLMRIYDLPHYKFTAIFPRSYTRVALSFDTDPGSVIDPKLHGFLFISVI